MKTLIFYDEAFAPGIKPENLGKEMCLTGRSGLSEALQSGQYSVFVNLHGSYFPEEAAEALFSFLEAGHGYLNFGGTPLKNADENCGRYQNGCATRQLDIYTSERLSGIKTDRVVNEGLPDDAYNEIVSKLDLNCTDEFVWNGTKENEEPDIWGSSGSFHVTSKTCITGYRGANLSYCYASIIDHWGGRFQSGRWLLVTGKVTGHTLNTAKLDSLFRILGGGSVRADIRCDSPVYRKGETPVITLSLHAFSMHTAEGTVRMWNRESFSGHVIFEQQCSLQTDIPVCTFPIEKDIDDGFYEIEADCRTEEGEILRPSQGFFFGKDHHRSAADEIICGKNYFFRRHADGRQEIMPVVGTSYMSDSYHRKFLFYPNPVHWAEDMKTMKERGVTWIRTGMWCLWRDAADRQGVVKEQVLRAFEAFLRCAEISNIHVTFCFFAFVPWRWDGTNSYLSPESLKAQRNYIEGFLEAADGRSIVDWDLINEPYVFDHPLTREDPEDQEEQKAFDAYLSRKYRTVQDCISCLNLDPLHIHAFEDIGVPDRNSINFSSGDMSDGKSGLVWSEYKTFCSQVFSSWIQKNRNNIEQFYLKRRWRLPLVTVGQDEAVYSQRPNQMDFGELLSYTCQHPWWHNDSILFSLRSSKLPDRPLLVQETGNMYSENGDSSIRRTEEYDYRLLKKKMACSFAAGGAGTLQWIWNTNYFLKSANESTIGAVRCDGTCKLEMDLFPSFAAFFQKAVPYMDDTAAEEDLLIMYPASSARSNRDLGKKGAYGAADILDRYLMMPYGVIDEDSMARLLSPGERDRRKTIILPSVYQISDQAFDILCSLAREEGWNVLISGPCILDEYGRRTERRERQISRITGGHFGVRPVGQVEHLRTGRSSYTFHFSGENAETALVQAAQSEERVSVYPYGKGRFCLVDIPIEISDNRDESARFYRDLLSELGVKQECRILVDAEENRGEVCFAGREFQQAVLWMLSNETTEDLDVRISDVRSLHALPSLEFDRKIKAQDTQMILISKSDGTVLAEL